MIIPVTVKPVSLPLNVLPKTVYVPDPIRLLVAEPVLAKVPLANEKVEIFKVPCVSVNAPFALNASSKVAVPVVLTVNAAIGRPLLVIVPVPRAAIVKPVKVPPLDNSKLFTFIVVVPGLPVNPLLKVSLLNQLPVVILPPPHAPVVNVRLGALVVEPFVVPNTVILLVVPGI